MPRLSVLMDIGPAVHQGAGLARYAERLAYHLWSGQAERVALTLFYNGHSGHQLPPSLAQVPAVTLPQAQIRWRLSVLASQAARFPYHPLVEQIRQARSAQSQRSLLPTLPGSTLYHATEHLLPRLPGPTVLTVHDLIFERYPEHHTRRNRWYLRVAMPLYVRAATAIIAVSHQTKSDLCDLYGTPAAKIHVVYEGIDATFAPASPGAVERVRRQYCPERPYLLMVGTLEPRKNHAAALVVLARIKAMGFPHRLLIVGGQGWRFEPIQRLVDQLGLGEDVIFAGYVPAVDLPPLYTGAACVLLPSLYEGFGFPVLEAMACGAPVVCSNASSLPEVAGDAALLVPPSDTTALADAIALVLSQPAVASALRQKGQAQAANFRWERCAAETAAVYAAASGQP